MAKKSRSKRTTICGVLLDREMAFPIGTHAGNMHMDKHTLKPWSEEARASAADTTNGLLMQVPFEEGGLIGIPIERLLRDGLISERPQPQKQNGHVRGKAVGWIEHAIRGTSF
jgi:hypothetical protein